MPHIPSILLNTAKRKAKSMIQANFHDPSGHNGNPPRSAPTSQYAARRTDGIEIVMRAIAREMRAADKVDVCCQYDCCPNAA